MGKWSSQLVWLFLIAAPCVGQNAAVTVTAHGGIPYDSRPFGKYLVETCTVTGEQLTVSCTKVPYPSSNLEHSQTSCPKPGELKCPAQLKDQNVTIKLVCDPASKAKCDPTNPKVGDDFFVSATADSGLPVDQKILLGADKVTRLSGSRTVHYHANAVGPLVIRATAPRKDCAPADSQACGYAASPPVDLILQISGEPPSKADACPVLPPSAPSQSKPLDAPTIVSLLGNPTPFVMAAGGANTIFVYATRQPLNNGERTILGSFQGAIAELAGRTVASLGIAPAPEKPFSVELKIPHASALGDLATRIGGLSYSQFTVQNVGRGSVRVTAPTQPDCKTWTNFLTDIREMAWQLVSQPMSKKLYFLSSSDVATAFAFPSAAAAPAASSSSTASTPASSASATPAAPAATAPAASSSPSVAASSTPAAAASASPAASSNATIAITQPPGSNIQISSDTTPCVVAGLAFGNSSACGSATAAPATASASATAAAPAATPPAQTPLNMASMAVAAGTSEQIPPDLLIYSDANPGDDAQIAERNRILALLDLPRPETILTAWVTQDSSASPQTIGAFNNMVKGLVADYDHEFENLVLKGWQSVKEQSAKANFFNEPFRSYIADRFVADTFKQSEPGTDVQHLSQNFLDTSQAQLADTERRKLGICASDRYCLGYNSLFNPLKPALTDLLLTIIAAQNPVTAAKIAANAVESAVVPQVLAQALTAANKSLDTMKLADCDHVLPPESEALRQCHTILWPRDGWVGVKGKPSPKSVDEMLESDCDLATPDPEIRKECHALWRNLGLDYAFTPRPLPNCEEKDLRRILGSVLNQTELTVRLQCFREEAKRLLSSADDPHPAGVGPYGVGLFRAAIADFLFNYKMSQHYPHEFDAYYLTQSANYLNNALSPMIDALNRDLWTYQLFVRADMQYRVERLNSRTDERCCVKKLFGLDKPSFFNDGLVTVRTISGQPTTVSTTSQSFLNGSTAPELPALLSSLAAIGGGGGGGGGGGSPAAATTGTTTTTTTTTTTGGSASPGPGSGGGGGGGASGLFGAYSALPAVLANYQTTYAQIGRQLSFSATPRSLATASSAEIAVTLNADESAGGPLYTGPGQTDPASNTSRVASHDTTTRVRVDSIKLFEVSSFSAIVERSRSRFPLLPPFVEIPYIGTFAGIPLGAAKEFHSSTAIISAYVVPTAADIAYGLQFVSDLVVDGLNSGKCSFYPGSAGPDVTHACVFRKMFSLHDVKEKPIREFNKKITGCFAMHTSQEECIEDVSFDKVLEAQ
jgi:hypothetical protein